jgi:hypothetical protein
MRNAALLLGLGTLAALTLGSPRSAAACPGCDADQWCEKGPAGTTCEVFEHDGQRWHRHTVECDDSLATVRLEVYPTAPHRARKPDTHTLSDPCRAA